LRWGEAVSCDGLVKIGALGDYLEVDGVGKRSGEGGLNLLDGRGRVGADLIGVWISNGGLKVEVWSFWSMGLRGHCGAK
jgi:hypothetical protein